MAAAAAVRQTGPHGAEYGERLNQAVNLRLKLAPLSRRGFFFFSSISESAAEAILGGCIVNAFKFGPSTHACCVPETPKDYISKP
jgi:hypothetical protein